MNTYDNILETTYKLFLKKGFHNVSSEDISNANNISPGTLYYHFKNKDEIIIAVFDKYVLGTYYECLDNVLKIDSEDTLSILSYFYKEMLGLDNTFKYTHIFNQEEDFKKILALSFEGIQEYEIINKNYNQFNKDYTKVLEEIINKGKTINQIRTDLSTDELVLFIKANLNGIFFLWVVQEGFDSKNIIETNIKHVWNYIKK